MLRAVGKVGRESQHHALINQRVPISLGYPAHWIVIKPVLEAVNCLKERQNDVDRVFGAARRSSVHGTYIIKAAVNARPL